MFSFGTSLLCVWSFVICPAAFAAANISPSLRSALTIYSAAFSSISLPSLAVPKEEFEKKISELKASGKLTSAMVVRKDQTATVSSGIGFGVLLIGDLLHSYGINAITPIAVNKETLSVTGDVTSPSWLNANGQIPVTPVTAVKLS